MTKPLGLAAIRSGSHFSFTHSCLPVSVGAHLPFYFKMAALLKSTLAKPWLSYAQTGILARGIARGPGGVAGSPGSTSGAGVGAVGCPTLVHSDKTLIDQRDPLEMQNFLTDLKHDTEQLFHKAAWRGEPYQNFKFAMREVNSTLRANYADLMRDVGNNILPMVCMNDADPGEFGTGTTVTLYEEDGTITRYVPTDKSYEFYKDLSHQLFGVFTYVGPYFKSPDSIGWISGLQQFQKKVQAAQYAAGISGLPPDAADRAQKMLGFVNDYINDAVTKKSADVPRYQAFAKQMIPFVEDNMKTATHLQTKALIPLMEEIKAKLGDKWEETYFIIPTVWPVAGINLRIQVLECVTSERQLRTHMITCENVHGIDDARITLGRVVGDRAMAQLTFGPNYTDDCQKHIYALSSPQDLMSDYMNDAILEFVKARGNRGGGGGGGGRQHQGGGHGRQHQNQGQHQGGHRSQKR